MRHRKQTGAVLAVSLIMLATITLLAVVAVNTGTTNLRVVGNQQAQKEVESASQTAVEQFVSTPVPFQLATCNPAPQTIAVNNVNVSVDITEPVCLGSTPAKGYSAVWGLAPEDTQWELAATGQHTATGAQAIIHQGVATLLSAGNCPLVPTTNPCP